MGQIRKYPIHSKAGEKLPSHIDKAIITAEQLARDGLSRFLHLIDFRLNGSVWPNSAIGACSKSPAEVFIAKHFAFEVEVQQFALLARDDDIVHQGIANIHAGVLTVCLLVASDIYGEWRIDDIALCIHSSYLCAIDAQLSVPTRLCVR